MRKIGTALCLVLLVTLFSGTAHAYVGPGAGFAFITSFFFLFATFFVAVFSLMIWPIRFVFVWFKSRRAMKNAKVKRVVVLGLDGMDPDLAEKWMQEGHLPNFKKLSETGAFRRLTTTFPSVSPVAWSSFMTGSNPGRHNIYDFLSRDKKNYLPVLSSAHIGPSLKSIKLGKYNIPIGKPELRLLRKSKPFWKILGENGIFSSVLRVPITFPPEKFKGVSLSGMCVPDILGTQGTFCYFTTRGSEYDDTEGGRVLHFVRTDKGVSGTLPGPPDALREDAPEMTIGFTIEPGKKNNTFLLKLPDQVVTLKMGEFSDWIHLTYKASLKVNVVGITRLLLTEGGENYCLYATPINLDPERPAFPISHPPAYALYLAKLIGPYANLGLAEDTWVLNEGLITDDQFLEETYMIHAEREKMFFDALEKTKSGAVVCVFDGTDRIQHMFFRYLYDGHPALAHYPESNRKDAIFELYKRSDDLLGRTLKKLGPKDALFVMSDHGFKPFVRGINLNSWLHQNGYLTLKEGAKGGKWLEDVDWSGTRAYQVGLGGLYINQEGRESQGIVKEKDSDALIRELIEKLSGLVDEEKGKVAINDVWAAKDIYKGPYVSNAPDMIIGYALTYRAGWDGTTGVVTDNVFEDNKKAWSGDHCMDPRVVPGVLFTNFNLADEKPSIMDIAPTVLDLLGIKAPPHMDGKALSAKIKAKEAVT